ncbi:hypothetical protein HYG77_23980 [Rhodococcus sp. ZPP]|nr:hypothetical protein HYG77_23980 [Rhodococcus sp. ZPP]
MCPPAVGASQYCHDLQCGTSHACADYRSRGRNTDDTKSSQHCPIAPHVSFKSRVRDILGFPRQCSCLLECVAGALHRHTPRTVVLAGPLRTHFARIAIEGVGYEYEESATGIVCVATPELRDASGDLR